MTRDEILNMPAGREMDDLIMIKVFGYRKEIDVTKKMYGQTKPIYKYFLGDKPFVNTIQLPPFSVNIEMAWTVVEKMTFFDLERNEDKTWACTYETKDTIDIAEADTAPLAICRAALLAVMEAE